MSPARLAWTASGCTGFSLCRVMTDKRENPVHPLAERPRTQHHATCQTDSTMEAIMQGVRFFIKDRKVAPRQPIRPCVAVLARRQRFCLLPQPGVPPGADGMTRSVLGDGGCWCRKGRKGSRVEMSAKNCPESACLDGSKTVTTLTQSLSLSVCLSLCIDVSAVGVRPCGWLDTDTIQSIPFHSGWCRCRCGWIRQNGYGNMVHMQIGRLRPRHATHAVPTRSGTHTSRTLHTPHTRRACRHPGSQPVSKPVV